MKLQNIIHVVVLLGAASLLGSCAKEEDAVVTAQSTIIASVNDEYISQADFELSETWLPDFVRQTDSGETLNMHRFYSLIHMMLLAQDAKKEHLLSDAETSMIIKEAQAELWLGSLPLPAIDLSDQTIENEINTHPDEYIIPARYTVNYSLVHSETSRQALAAAFGLVSGAQVGYNYVDPPELEKNPNAVEGMPRLKNEGGHPREVTYFNYSFANALNDKANDVSRLGPFSAQDDLMFSCPEAIAALEAAPVGRALDKNISCDSNWIAFVIPEWKAPRTKLDPGMAKLHARQKLIDRARNEMRERTIQAEAALYKP